MLNAKRSATRCGTWVNTIESAGSRSATMRCSHGRRAPPIGGCCHRAAGSCVRARSGRGTGRRSIRGDVMSLAQTVLVLFDIDGTLVDTTGAGVRGMNTAFERLHGRPAALSGVAVAGRTDLAILTEIYGASGIGFERAHVPTLRDAYLDELRREMSRDAGAGFGVLPGVHAALDALDADPSFTLG